MKKLYLSLLAMAALHTQAQQPVLVNDINPGTAQGALGLNSSVVYNGKLYFGAQDAASNFELWATDGTSAGTTLVKDIKATGGSFPYDYFVFNNKLYFAATSDAEGGELWMTDGTTTGTSLVKDIWPGTTSAYPRNFVLYNNSMYFTAEEPGSGGFHHVIYKSDGTAAGTAPLSLGPWTTGSIYYAKQNSKLYFGASNTLAATGPELWETDGTLLGTQVLKDINVGTSGSLPEFLTPFGTNKFVFSANEAGKGYELYISDGAAAGTTLLKDINPGAGNSYPDGFYEWNGKMYFFANNGTAGREPWVTDGTAAGTMMLKDVFSGSDGSVGQGAWAKAGNKLVFVAETNGDGYELWATDGTTAGTDMVKNINGSNTGSVFNIYTENSINNKLYFVGNDGVNGNEPWVTDGTDTGTKMIYNLAPGIDSSMETYDAYRFIQMDTSIYFVADDGTSGKELYKIKAPVVVGVNDVAKQPIDVRIYPNPTTGVVTINTNGKTLHAAVYNAFGQLVLQQDVNDSRVTLQNNAAGMYYIRLSDDNKQTYQQKIMLLQ